MASLRFRLIRWYIKRNARSEMGMTPAERRALVGELLLDDSTRLADCARAAGVSVDLQVWPEMFHEWQQLVRIVPESTRAVAAIGAFVRQHTTG